MNTTSSNVMQKLDKKKILDIIVMIVAISMGLFHIYAAFSGRYQSYQLSSIHWALVGTYIILTRPLRFKGGKIIDTLLISVNIYITIHLLVLKDYFITNAGIYTDLDIFVSVVAIVSAIVIAQRVIGKILPIISLIFIAYAMFGYMIPGTFRVMKFSLERIAPFLYTSTEGLYGQTLYISAQYIFLFVLFGAVLEMTGAGKFFVNLAFAATGRVRGGPAQAAVCSSMLMGTINGSGAANVVTTGTFTIPLMKKVGFDSETSGAIEAVASSGGQIMPPVMGAVAFLMSEMTGLSYASIAIAALVPALLYYITLSISIYITARRENIPVVEPEERLKVWDIIKSGWICFVPLVSLIAILLSGYSVQKSAMYSILISIVVGFIHNRKNMTVANFINAFKKAAGGIAPIAGACILAGIVMGVINLTGLGLKISGIITEIANGRLIIALILAMFTSLLLGMGLPTSAAYMILAILVAPAIIEMGVTAMAAHLFILYFGALSTITPPVALSTFAAAGIAGGNIWKTGVQSMKFAATGFIIPFIFCYQTELLLMGTAGNIIFSIITAVIGCGILSVALNGWFIQKLTIISRIFAFVCAILLILPKPLIANALGIILFAIIILIEVFIVGNKTKISEDNSDEN